MHICFYSSRSYYCEGVLVVYNLYQCFNHECLIAFQCLQSTARPLLLACAIPITLQITCSQSATKHSSQVLSLIPTHVKLPKHGKKRQAYTYDFFHCDNVGFISVLLIRNKQTASGLTNCTKTIESSFRTKKED